MNKIELLDKYPVYSMVLKKMETDYKNSYEVVKYFKDLIEKHPAAIFIAEFDHLSHTMSLPEHKVCDGIVDARNIVFCFGKEISNPKILAVRPRSIAICEFDDYFDISFLEVPNEQLQKVVVQWVENLNNRG